MNPVFTLKNFRSFGKNGASFELSPITVLTGCNSAGKSSLVKALTLLCHAPGEGYSQYHPLELYKKEIGLGSFDGVINERSTDDRFELSYTIFSNILQERVMVSRIYGKYRNNLPDSLNDAYLIRCTIKAQDGTFICEKEDQGMGLYHIDIINVVHRIDDMKINIEYIRPRFENFYLASSYAYSLLKHVDDEAIELFCEIEKRNIRIEKYDIDLLLGCMRVLSEAREEQRVMGGERQLATFTECFVREVCNPWFKNNKTDYLGSANNQIKRVYPIEDNSRFGHALRTFHSRQRIHNEWNNKLEFDDNSLFSPGEFINRWVKKFGIADKIEIKSDGEGSVKVYCVRDKHSRILADEGYGITHLLSLLLEIESNITITSETGDPKPYWCKTDSLLTFTFEFSREREKRLMCIEEPELHLHPKFQSMLAEMFVEAWQKYNIHFVIETHSEYFIRKLQVLVADKACKLSPNDVSINYVSKDEAGISSNRQIKIEGNGRLSEPFGEGFYDEADSLAIELLRFNARK